MSCSMLWLRPESRAQSFTEAIEQSKTVHAKQSSALGICSVFICEAYMVIVEYTANVSCEPMMCLAARLPGGSTAFL